MRDIKPFEFSIKCLEIDLFIQKKNPYILFESDYFHYLKIETKKNCKELRINECK